MSGNRVITKFLISTTFILSFTGYALSNPENSPLMDANLEKARGASMKLLSALKSQLTEALKEKKPEKAVMVCSAIGQSIARNVAEEENLFIRRVSLRYRNPNDMPDEYEKGMLEHFENLKHDNKLPDNYEVYEEVTNGEKRYFRYMKPLIATQMCLQCHGNPKKDISLRVSKILKEKYPDDLAVNHKVGDIRGAVSVLIPVNESKN